MKAKTEEKTFLGDSLVLVAMAIFGSYALFLRLYPHIPPLVFLWAFQIIGMVCFFVIAKYQGMPRLTRRDYLLLFALAVVAILNDLCHFFALTITSVANAAVAHQSVSLFLLVLAPIFLGEKTRKAEWIALGVSLTGIAVLYSNQIGASTSKVHLLGITLGVASGLFLAFLIVLYRMIPDTSRGITISVVNFWRYAMSSVLLLPIVPLMKLGELQSRDIIPLAVFGIVFAVIASGIHNYGISKTRSLHVSILGKSEPVFAVVYAALFLEEHPPMQAVVGGILITGSSLWLAFIGKENNQC